MMRRTIGTVSIGALLALASVTGVSAQQKANPCATKNPCAPKAANPCATKNPCAAERPRPSEDPLTARTGIPNAFDGYIHSGSGR